MSSADVNCGKCGKQFRVSAEYFQRYGEDPYCHDCLIHTECRHCGKGLRIQPSRYQELGGEPVSCTDCSASTGGNGRSSDTWFWHGLTEGEKLIFPVLALLFIGALGIVATIEMNGGNAGGFVPGGYLS